MTTLNGVKTALLLGVLSAFLLLAGQMIGGRSGLQVALFMAVLMNFASYFFSEKIALAMYSAQPVTPSENPHIYGRVAPVVHNLCQRMGLPVPKLWVIPDPSPNAFATGRNPEHAAIAVTRGLIDVLERLELEAVIAHELSHVKNRDILTSSIAATIAAAITYLAQIGHFAMLFGGRSRDDDDNALGGAATGLLMLIVAPIAAMLIQMAISRTREFAADGTAAKYSGTPQGLISALRKLEAYSKRIPMEASPATAHMFIIQPFTGSAFMKLFSTHPPTEERIARLSALA
ncbi:MAG TPA: zinc metalloprotease HtpX [Bryobacteraceae bacterium]|nr:zinc metalloprotease HtpX [Bryobacteraceae bacterium]